MTGLAPCFPCPSPESAEQGGWRQGAWHRAMKKSQEEVSRISCFLLCPLNDGAGATGAQHPGVGRQGGGPPARGPPGSSQPGSRTFAPQTPRAQLQGRGSVDPSLRAQEHHCTAIPLAGNSIFLQAPNTHTHTHPLQPPEETLLFQRAGSLSKLNHPCDGGSCASAWPGHGAQMCVTWKTLRS